MALMEAKILTVMLHQKFVFDLKAGEKITYSRMITMSGETVNEIVVEWKCMQLM